MEYFDKFTADQEADEPTTRRQYKAVIPGNGNRRLTRLRIAYADGKVSIVSYSYLQEILYSNHQNLSLIFTSSVITLQGRNLGGVLDVLQEDRAKAIQCYSEALYTDEPSADEPVVLSIKRQSLREFGAAGDGGEEKRKKESASPTN